MDTPAARAMVVAICLQESGLRTRKQVRGPARGYPQFELAGVQGVIKHTASSPHLAAALNAIDYIDRTAIDLLYSMEENDVLGAVFARLLLWTHPKALPSSADHALAWAQYTQLWRPGKPHPDTWQDNYRRAWAAVEF